MLVLPPAAILSCHASPMDTMSGAFGRYAAGMFHDPMALQWHCIIGSVLNALEHAAAMLPCNCTNCPFESCVDCSTVPAMHSCGYCNIVASCQSVYCNIRCTADLALQHSCCLDTIMTLCRKSVNKTIKLNPSNIKMRSFVGKH